MLKHLFYFEFSIQFYFIDFTFYSNTIRSQIDHFNSNANPIRQCSTLFYRQHILWNLNYFFFVIYFTYYSFLNDFYMILTKHAIKIKFTKQLFFFSCFTTIKKNTDMHVQNEPYIKVNCTICHH